MNFSIGLSEFSFESVRIWVYWPKSVYA